MNKTYTYIGLFFSSSVFFFFFLFGKAKGRPNVETRVRGKFRKGQKVCQLAKGRRLPEDFFLLLFSVFFSPSSGLPSRRPALLIICSFLCSYTHQQSFVLPLFLLFFYIYFIHLFCFTPCQKY